VKNHEGNRMKAKRLFFIIGELLLVLSIAGCSLSSSKVIDNVPETADPYFIGEKVVERYLSKSFMSGGGVDASSGKITFKEVYAWLGAIEFSENCSNEEMLQALQQRFYPLLGSKKQLVPNSGLMEDSGFGALPLQLFLNSDNDCFFYLGIDYADQQWKLPSGIELSKRSLDCADEGLSWQSRFTTADMFVVSVLQSNAFLSSGDEKYLNRAAYQMAAYIDSLQQTDGLFFHSPDTPFYWCRANGWMASAMTQLLKVLPESNIHHPKILAAYLKIMTALEKNRNEEGLWNQLIDQKDSWTETSGSAMFIYAIVSGLKHGWLEKDTFRPLVKKSWVSLISYLNENGGLRNVCQETNDGIFRENFPERTDRSVNLIGQATILWCAAAFVEE
jgi:unsaturated rhamnogalacturonyl hydrolase